jgi:multiple sugar transport system ATP-binding protein
LGLSHLALPFNNLRVPRIVLEDVRKTFPGAAGPSVAAVAGISLTVADRELLTIVGPSGSGKTTLLRLVAGLEMPDAGRILVADQDITWQSPRDRDVALVFQAHALFPHFTAAENLGFGLKLRGVTRGEIQKRVQEIAGQLGVAHCLDRRPAKLSGGERQRVALGRALIRQPKILLLDEPFAHLDELLRAQLQAELLALRHRFATTMIFVTHRQEEALVLGDRVAVLRKGQLQQVGSPREIYHRPANHFVASFIGSPGMNLIHGVAAQREGNLVFLGAETGPDETPPRFVLLLGSWRSDWFGANLGRRILLGLRPRAIQVITSAAEMKAGDLPDAVVARVQFTGNDLFCAVTVAEREIIASASPGTELQSGQKVQLRFDFTDARVFDAATGGAIF